MKQKKKKPLNQHCVWKQIWWTTKQTNKQTNKQKTPHMKFDYIVCRWHFFLLFHGSNTVAQMIRLLAVKRLDRFHRYAVLAFLLFSVRLDDKSICCSYAIVTEICADLRAKIKKERKKETQAFFVIYFKMLKLKSAFPIAERVGSWQHYYNFYFNQQDGSDGTRYVLR